MLGSYLLRDFLLGAGVVVAGIVDAGLRFAMMVLSKRKGARRPREVFVVRV